MADIETAMNGNGNGAGNGDGNGAGNGNGNGNGHFVTSPDPGESIEVDSIGA